MAAPDIMKLLKVMIGNDASDLHLTVGRPPTLRLNGGLRSTNQDPLTPDDTLAIATQIAPAKYVEEMNKVGSADFAYAHPDGARFRTSIFRQKGAVGIVMRLIPNRLLSFADIGLPEGVQELCTRPRGLVLVTGPTGSGKTTTLATMIDWINENRERHIITIEDPVEYYHEHKKSVMTQRELGQDVGSFPEALRRALRQDPDVILVGEMRDLETIQSAISAAETGHLVFGTLHTTGSARTVDRIIDVFPTNQQEQIRTQLSVSVIGVLSQVLCPTADGKGRVAAFELMLMNSAIENLIRENKTFRIPSTIQTSKREGMILLDDYLFDLYLQQKITAEVALEWCAQPDDLAPKIKQREKQLQGA
jgi:twitching motility protein PilT